MKLVVVFIKMHRIPCVKLCVSKVISPPPNNPLFWVGLFDGRGL